MPNIKFSFLYQDAANYKTFGEILFSNPEQIGLEEIETKILSACNENGNFDPQPWGIPNIRTQPYDPELDHDWYEIESIEETEEMLTDGRSIDFFLRSITAIL
jgi:hypothetical protein